MPSALRIAPLFLIPVLAALAIHAEASDPSPFNIVWDRPSANSSESMPAGGRDTGLNVWVEAGELLIYVQRSGSIAENNEYLKLGRLRLKPTPNPFAEGRFRQELIPREGRIEIAGDLETGGKTEPVTVQVWAEVARPVVHVEISAGSEIDVLASYENWRRSRELIPDTDRRRSTFTLDKYPGEVWLGADTVSHQGDKVLFFHRNPDQGLLPDLLIRQQGLEEHREKIANDLSGRTFGGLVGGVGFRAAGTSEGKYQATPFQAWHLSSRQAARRHHLRLVSHVAQSPTLEDWQGELQELWNESEEDLEAARKATLAWWAEFWNRSWIVIDPENPDLESRPWRAARNYTLFRYQLGGNAFGEYPTKFNGGNLVFDPSLVQESRPYPPDWRGTRTSSARSSIRCFPSTDSIWSAATASCSGFSATPGSTGSSRRTWS